MVHENAKYLNECTERIKHYNKLNDISKICNFITILLITSRRTAKYVLYFLPGGTFITCWTNTAFSCVTPFASQSSLNCTITNPL